MDLTVRLAHLRGPVGGAATVTQNSLVWEVPIAEVLLDGSGDFSALTDVRRFVKTPLANSVDYRQGGDATNWNVSGTTDYAPAPAETMTIIGSTTTDLVGTATVVFPVEFGGVPHILHSPRGVAFVALLNLATTGFDIETYDVDGVTPMSATVFWEAKGPR